MTDLFAPVVTSAVEQLAATWWQPVTDNERQSLAGQKREVALNLTVYLAHRLIRGLRCDVGELVLAGQVIRPMLRGQTGPARLVVGHASYPAIASIAARGPGPPGSQEPLPP